MIKALSKKKLFYIKLATLIIICFTTGVVFLDLYCKKIFPGARYNNFKEYLAYYLEETVLRGLVVSPIANALFTKSENLSTTKLPVWEIQLSGRKLAALNKDLPGSGRIYKSGTLIVNSIPFSAKFRFRGDSFWHWKSKQKSWKIRLKGDKRFEGRREFNLVNPKSTTTLIWPLAFYTAQMMGLKTPRIQHVHARLNGQYLGVLYLVENFDHDFTAQNGLPEGALYEDEALGPYHHQSWEEVETWKIRPPGSKQKYQAGSNPKERYENRLNELLRSIDLKDDREFFHQMEELFDIDYYLKWWAHTVVCLDIHQDRRHNNRLYLDPTSAKFRQIPWDMYIPAETGVPQGKIDLNLNPIIERLLQSPEYIHARNKIIWEAIHGPASVDKQIRYLNKMVDLIREDIYCDPHKDARSFTLAPFVSIKTRRIQTCVCILPVSNGIFERDIKKIKDFLSKRMVYLEQTLSETDVKMICCSTSSPDLNVPDECTLLGQLNIQVGGQEGVIAREIKAYFKSALPPESTPLLFYGNSNQLVKKEGEKVAPLFSDDREVYSFKLNELLLPGRMRKPPFGPAPVRYPFAITLASSRDFLPAILEVEVRGIHPLTGKEIIIRTPPSELKSNLRSIPIGRFQSPPSPPQKIIWKGIKRIEEDCRMGKDEMLVIRPGTRIEFSEGSSLLSYGKVIAVGTVESPVVFTHAQNFDSWGVVALQSSGANGSIFKHCIFEYGGDDELDRVFYSGALSIYNADATIEECLFRFSQGDDALNTKFSSTDVLKSRFIGNKADAYDLDFSDGLIVGNVFKENGNDGIDCGGAHPTIRDNRISNCGDKGISIGERSSPLVEDNIITRCKTGIAVKDQSCPEIRRNEFIFNKTAVEAYQKKKVFGGVDVVIKESIFEHNERLSKSDEVSSVTLVDCSSESTPIVNSSQQTLRR